MTAYWDRTTEGRDNSNMQRLVSTLHSPDPYCMTELFAQQGFGLGQSARDVYRAILGAWIGGETSLDHVRYFFRFLGGGFYTTASKDSCVWSEIADLERAGTPHTYEEFIRKFDNIRALVLCLADEFSMPVNPQTLDAARAQNALMLICCMVEREEVKQYWLRCWPDRLG
jgi:hypothetical protein